MSRRVAPKLTVKLTENEISLRETRNGKLIFTTYRGRICGMLLQNDRLVSVTVLQGFHPMPSEDKGFENPSEFLQNVGSKVGAIYIGKIKNVVKNINAYFVEIEKGEICFLSFAKAKNVHVLNRTNDGRLLEGDEIIVQVERDAQKTKQASVTTNINLSDAEEWESLKQKAIHRTCYTCLKAAPSPLENALNQYSPEEYQEIVTDNEDIYGQLQAIYHNNIHSSSHSISLSTDNDAPSYKSSKPMIRLYQDKMLSLTGVYGLNSKMDMALERRIWLKSGGYLILEPTEALTVIDVNSGKYEAKKDAEETYYKINLEAAEEIAIQLRLRNLSGIIVVDFINMHSKENKQALMHKLKELVSYDKTTTVVVDMTPLGLVEITRKKVNKPLAEYFSKH